MLSLEYCKQRQQRLLRHMETASLDLAVLGSARLGYYFSGALVDGNWPQVFALRSNGDSVVITNAETAQCASPVQTYTGYTTQRPFGRQTMQEELVGILSGFTRGARRIGADLESLSSGIAASLPGPLQNLTPALTEMRRRKDPDEIECMRRTTRITEAGYAAIKSRVEPGMTEYEAYSVIHEAVVSAAETSVDLRGDFACGTRAIQGGGPPTNRRVNAGDLYILDLFPVFEGYMCDLCRTFCAGTPSQEQYDVWAHVSAAHEIAKRLIVPGLPVRDVYEEIRTYLDRYPLTKGSFTHHAGHGVGMEGWEQPWLNPGDDRVFVEGEVIACEPGLYSRKLNGGVRLEHNYLVTLDGPVPLDSFPLDL